MLNCKKERKVMISLNSSYPTIEVCERRNRGNEHSFYKSAYKAKASF